jgi:NAD(P)-dependent dehydrogenase (short-subunit alcohol dehydrogenase family)
VRSVIMLGLTSDIGRELALRYHADGWHISGTCRAGSTPSGLPGGVDVFECDFADAESVDRFTGRWSATGEKWDLIVAAVGTEEPIGPFAECGGNDWDRGIFVNALGPLRAVRGLLASRRVEGEPAVAFFSGSGTNSAAPSYSAYAASKILLIKMCELLDAESADTRYFIIGPGIVRTKIHQQTLDAAVRAGKNLGKVEKFLGSDEPGTDHREIHACLSWCLSQPKAVIGGRNLSLVFDAWRRGGSDLAAYLLSNPDAYKLRRLGNDIRLPHTPQ